MVEEVIWIDRSKRNFDKILAFLKADWSMNIADDFYQRTHYVVELISKFPEMGIVINERKVLRRFLITKQNYLIYRLIKNKLVIVNIVDTRKKEL